MEKENVESPGLPSEQEIEVNKESVVITIDQSLQEEKEKMSLDLKSKELLLNQTNEEDLSLPTEKNDEEKK